MTPTTRELDRLEQDVGELLEAHGDGPDLEQYSEYEDRPVAFIEDVLGGELTAYQKRIARAMLDSPMLTVRSCHASGKDWLAGRLALWWTYARRGLVVISGPTSAQVEEILMRGEVRDAFRGSGLPGDLHVKALRPGGTGRAGIIAKTATGTGRLTGFHDARVLFLLTEAQDPECEPAWGAAFAVTTGAEDRIVTLGNPTEPSGRFFEAHQAGSDWRSFRIAASDIPNVEQEKTVVPGLLTLEGVERFASEYGRDSAYYRSRVEAEFPEEASDALVKREWLERAEEAHRGDAFEDERGTYAVVAVDVARFGRDRSVLCVRRGPHVEEFRTWQGEDTQQVAGRVLREVRRVHGSGEGPVKTVVVDAVGIGAGVYDRVKEELDTTWQESTGRGRSGNRTGLTTKSTRVEEFNGGSKAKNTDRFRDLRSQAFWRVRSELEEGRLALPPGSGVGGELRAIRSEVTSDGKTKIESKDATKSRLSGASPDYADALSMSYLPELEDGDEFGLVLGG